MDSRRKKHVYLVSACAVALLMCLLAVPNLIQKGEDPISPPWVLLEFMVELQQEYYGKHGIYFATWQYAVQKGWPHQMMTTLTRMTDDRGMYLYDLMSTESTYAILAIPLDNPDKFHYYVDQDGIVTREKGAPASKNSQPIYDVFNRVLTR